MIVIFKKMDFFNTFASNVITLIISNILAQSIPFFIAPLLTRIYSPREFGLCAVFTGISFLLSVLATGRYELAINLPKTSKQAFSILLLSLLLTCIFSIFLMGVIFFWGKDILFMLGKSEMDSLIYFLPFSVFLISVYQCLTYWCTRKKYYKQLAINKITQSSFIGVFQLLSSILGLIKVGLIVGEIVGRIVSTVLILTAILRRDKKQFVFIRYYRFIIVAKRYIDFPKYLILSHGINTLSSLTPVLFSGVFWGSSFAGFVALADRVLRAPIDLIGGAIRDVIRQEMADEYAKKNKCNIIFLKVFKILITVSLIIFIPLFFLLPSLFTFVFGLEWRVAGEYAQILIPMIAMGLVASPLSIMYIIAEKQQLDLFMQLLRLSFTIVSVLGGVYYSNPEVFLGLYAFTISFWYIINLFFSYRLSCGICSSDHIHLMRSAQE